MDDFSKSQAAPLRRPGRPPALSDSAVIPLLCFSQWRRFGSERDFYRYADTQLRDAFTRLPDRSRSTATPAATMPCRPPRPGEPRLPAFLQVAEKYIRRPARNW